MKDATIIRFQDLFSSLMPMDFRDPLSLRLLFLSINKPENLTLVFMSMIRTLVEEVHRF